LVITRFEQIPTRTNTTLIFAFVSKKQGLFKDEFSFTTICFESQ